MYDTLKLVLYIKDIPIEEITPIDRTKAHFVGISDWQEKNVKYTKHKYNLLYPKCSGKDSGWTIWVKRDRYIIEGSLAKWYFGNNIQTLTLAQAKKGIVDLGRDIGVGKYIYKAEVKRIDFSSNVYTKNPPHSYFPLLDFLIGFYRHHIKDHKSVYYDTKTGDRQIVVYDKKLEAEQNKMTIPSEAKGYKNILRFEVRYKTKGIYNYLSKLKINKKPFNVSDMLEERRFTYFADEWFELYQKIEKINHTKDIMPAKNKRTAKEISEAVFARLMNEIGLSKVLDYVELEYQLSYKGTEALRPENRRKVQDAKKNIKQTYNIPITKAYEPIAELNQLMKERQEEIKETMMRLDI